MSDANTSGRFFVIEGTDASGKTTQFQKLAERLASEGYDVVTFDFPQYDLDSSFYVREYLMSGRETSTSS
jgi:dTMP kinase